MGGPHRTLKSLQTSHSTLSCGLIFGPSRTRAPGTLALAALAFTSRLKGLQTSRTGRMLIRIVTHKCLRGCVLATGSGLLPGLDSSIRSQFRSCRPR